MALHADSQDGAPATLTGAECFPSNEPTSTVAPLSKQALNRQHHSRAEHGNYHNYYYHRTPSVPDARLQLLEPFDLFRGRRVLDLGCNAGKLTMEVVSHLGATSALGLDIDPVLVARAQSLAADASVLDCSFAQADFMADPLEFFSGAGALPGQPAAADAGRFDTVLLLSITKWLHLHHGDEGLRALFAALFAYLAHEGGTLVVEPQEYENYVKATNKNKALKPMFHSLAMRPPFEVELRAAGFALLRTIERAEGGFSRPLLVWRADKA